MKNVNYLDKDTCTGCGLCYNICPVNAIEMKENQEGFLEPIIDENKCIDCEMCLNKCPQSGTNTVYHSTNHMYAIICKDNIRENCSSGGVFGAISEWCIVHGGIVFGASFVNNFKQVHHVSAINANEIKPLYKSKYLQSEVGQTYKKIEKMLSKTDAPVIFCGCPCQVDALKIFLKKDYANLITIDILCHGVASPKAYGKFLDEIFGDVDSPIKNVDFRSSKYGWARNLVITAEDGTERVSPHDGSYFNAYLWGYSQRKACFSCKYACMNRVGDITIGDFWGINEILPEMYDKKGTSLVSCNSKKGKEVLDFIDKYILKIKKCDLTDVLKVAEKYNWAMIKPGNMPTNRDIFFYRLAKGDCFSQALRYASMPPYDVGILGWWFEDNWTNYGSTLSYYALMEYVSSLGLSVCMLTSPYHHANAASDFIRKHGYVISPTYSFNDFYKHNSKINTFLIGSDQLWFYNCYKSWKHILFLDFAFENKKKIAYATSFGHKDPKIPSHEIPTLEKLLKKFDAISVRENDGIKILESLFHIVSVQAIDPVFLCDIKNWDDISNDAKRKVNGDYIFTYMLDPSEEKKKLLRKVSEKLGVPIVSITDRQYDKLKKETMLIDYGILRDASINELVYHIKNAKYIVTDSYHGTCFSLIFCKPFCSIVNPKRGTSRFDTLSTLFQIGDRFIYDINKLDNIDAFLSRPNYSQIIPLIDKAVKKSKAWLSYELLSENTK